MKKIRISIIVLLSCLPCLAFSQDADGGQPGAFLRQGVGARALGMGRAFTAMADDASSIYWNPAGLGGLRLRELMGTYSIQSMGRSHNYVAAAFPIRSIGSIGLSWINYHVGEIEGRDTFGRVLPSFTNGENAYLVSLGLRLNSFLYIGGTAKYITHALENHRSTGFGFDAGILVKVKELLRIGASFQDISTSVEWDTDAGMVEKFPLAMRFGAAIQPVDFPLYFCADLVKIENQDLTFHGGIEADIFNVLSLRAGYDHGGLTAGGTISIPTKKLNILTDYSVGADPIDLTYVHRISLRILFSPYDYYFHEYTRSDLGKLNGYMSEMYPPPDARVIQILDQYPNYALINIGYDDGVMEGMLFLVHRSDPNADEESEKKILIGRVKVAQVENEVSAVRVEWLRTGYQLRQGDVLIRK